VFLWPYLSFAKKLRDLKSLAFTIMETDISNIYNIFSNLTALEKISIKIVKGSVIEESKKTKQITQIWRFLKDLLGLKQLKALKMNIEGGCFVNEDNEFFGKFCELIGKRVNPIEDLNLSMYIESCGESFVDNVEARFLLEIEELSFNLYDLNAVEGLKNSYKKSLNLCFPRTKQNDVSSVISRCLSLKKLFIQVETDNIILNDNLFIGRGLKALEMDFTKAANERIPETLSSLAKALESSRITSFSISLSKIEEATFKELINIHKNFSLSLEEYILKTSNPYSGSPSSRSNNKSSLDSNILETFTESLVNYNSIKNLRLQLNLQESSSIQYIQNLVNGLSALVQLDLVLYSAPLSRSKKTQEKFYFELDSEVFKQLESLRLKLDDVFGLKDLKDFFERVSESSNLNELTVECEEMNEARLRDREIIAENLAKLSRVRSLFLGSKTKQIQSQIELARSNRASKMLQNSIQIECIIVHDL